MIHVLRTSVETDEHVQRIGSALNSELGDAEWNFDLDDCDHILRIADSSPEKVKRCMQVLQLNGFSCEELSD